MANGDCLIVSCSFSCISRNMICLISYSDNVICVSVTKKSVTKYQYTEYLRHFQALLYQISYVFLVCEIVASSSVSLAIIVAALSTCPLSVKSDT